MPITPVHLGPGLLAKGLVPSRFRLLSFTLVQAAIDIESILDLASGRYPVHARLHTLVGAMAGAVVTVPVAWLLMGWAQPWISRLPGSPKGRPPLLRNWLAVASAHFWAR